MSFKVIGIGEVLWDLLPSGPQLGGAPANFVCHAAQLGASAQLISRVGADPLGQRILASLAQRGLDTTTLQTDSHLPTGSVGVALGTDGTPQFTIHTGVAWDALTVTDNALATVRHAAAICFGTLAQRTPEAARAIRQLVTATPFNALRVFDINLRQNFYREDILAESLAIANVLKLNDAELVVLSQIFNLAGTITQKMEALASRFELQLVALTRAERGSLLYQGGQWSELPGRAFQVVDTVGAGDAFTAALVMGLLHRYPLQEIHRVADSVATFVCSHHGATPELPPTLRAMYLENCPTN
ncbi:MAG TPA: carbohydrate kinase [Verrucomicrobiae bacterium]